MLKLEYVINTYRDSLHIIFYNTNQKIVNFHIKNDSIRFTYELRTKNYFVESELLNPKGQTLTIF